jgi:hypothetical protein
LKELGEEYTVAKNRIDALEDFRKQLEGADALRCP